MKKAFWHQKRHGIKTWLLMIISLWMAAVALEVCAEILFTSAGNNYLGLSFWQSVRWFFVEWSFVGYITAIATMWIRKFDGKAVIIGMICYVLLFANYINGEWSSYWFSFSSISLISVYVICTAFYGLTENKK
ncbi:hypothetical protein [Secundilactobacillus kimchicus]|uniref:hypothetical protein n=1 Tax=Secundilactobacillus kimchicus TaxID=528209 RepID=UPI0024A8AA5A|nr:hypothetical protein [Secundilactobacillus kimchicus]